MYSQLQHHYKNAKKSANLVTPSARVRFITEMISSFGIELHFYFFSKYFFIKSITRLDEWSVQELELLREIWIRIVRFLKNPFVHLNSKFHLGLIISTNYFTKIDLPLNNWFNIYFKKKLDLINLANLGISGDYFFLKNILLAAQQYLASMIVSW